MKKLLIAVLLMGTFSLNAQQPKQADRKDMRKERRQAWQDLTPQEMANLKTKRMTLALDLSQEQQEKIMALNLDEAQRRQKIVDERNEKMKNREEAMQNRKELSKEKRLELAKDRLDRQIELKAKMKQILNEDQFTKWEASQQKNRRMGARSMRSGNRQ